MPPHCPECPDAEGHTHVGCTQELSISRLCAAWPPPAASSATCSLARIRTQVDSHAASSQHLTLPSGWPAGWRGNDRYRDGGCALANTAQLRSGSHAAATCQEGLVHDALCKRCWQRGEGVLVGTSSSIAAAGFACSDRKAMSELRKGCPGLKTVIQCGASPLGMNGVRPAARGPSGTDNPTAQRKAGENFYGLHSRCRLEQRGQVSPKGSVLKIGKRAEGAGNWILPMHGDHVWPLLLSSNCAGCSSLFVPAVVLVISLCSDRLPSPTSLGHAVRGLHAFRVSRPRQEPV